MYEDGLGVERNFQKAIEWYTKSAEQGNSSAQNNIAVMYRKGLGVECDYQKAIELYTKAMENGNAMACNNLGYTYTHGLGVEQDYQKAIELYTKSIEQGCQYSYMELGHLYINGFGVERNFETAIEYFIKATTTENKKAITKFLDCKYMVECILKLKEENAKLQKEVDYYDYLPPNGKKYLEAQKDAIGTGMNP